jgi:hypothetical protein
MTTSKEKQTNLDKQDHISLALWAADCAEHVLPYFEQEYPDDDRPVKAIDACRTWVRTGIFQMAQIRGVSLAAHAAAREAKGNNPACFAARAAGQAVATAHVPQHAFGAAYYALKAVAAANPDNAEAKAVKELDWQAKHLPTHLEQEVLDRVLIQKRGRGIFIKIVKGEGFY